MYPTKRNYDGSEFYSLAGRIMGGGSSVNMMSIPRPIKADLDAWAAQSNPDWSWEKVLPVLKRIEADQDFPLSPIHGNSGPIYIKRKHVFDLELSAQEGYTLLGSLLGQVATMTVANPKAPANLVRDFQPLAILHGYAAVIMLGRADSEIKTLKDLVAQAQKKPGDLIVAVGPPGTSLTLEVELLKRAGKIDLTSLPFAGSAQAITNLLGGHVNFAMASDVAAQPHIKAGKLIGLAVDVESAILPDVPTFAKQGYAQVNLLASVAFLAPKGLPEATAKVLTDAIRKSVQEPKLQENLGSRGYNIDLRTAEADVNKLVKDEINKYCALRPKISVGKRNRLRFGARTIISARKKGTQTATELDQRWVEYRKGSPP
jgi:tripartite-type tricarboxylate transporter receptor subunit TctC